nr:craniofacial development protein 2-like [Biomphalaria glabrata]
MLIFHTFICTIKKSLGHSDQLMPLRLPLDGCKFATVISAYTHTLRKDFTVTRGEPRRAMCKVDAADKLFIIGSALDGKRLQRLVSLALAAANDNGRLLLKPFL